MSAPAASGLFHVPSAASSLPTGALLAVADGGVDDPAHDPHDSPLHHHHVHHSPHNHNHLHGDALFRGKAARSKSFVAQKPVVLFALEKKPEDRGSSGSNSSSTSTASTGSHSGGSNGSGGGGGTDGAAAQPPLAKKHPRKSASSIIASSLGIVGNAAGGDAGTGPGARASLAKSHSVTTPMTPATVLTMASPGGGGSRGSLPSPTGSASSSTDGGLGPRSSSLSSLSASSASASPLPTSLLALSAERRAALTEFIDKAVDDAYKLCHGFGRIRWHAFKTREGVSICRAHGEDDQRLDAAVRGRCNVTASFREMLDALTTESSAAFAAHERAVNPSEFLDGRVLATLVPRTADDRFVCIKWHGVKSLAPSVAKHRDYVYVEVVDQFVDQDGKRVGYRLAKSVELAEAAAALDASSDLFVRGKTLTVQTFSEVAHGHLELTTMMVNDLGERLPTWLVHKIVDTAAMRVACLRDHLNQRRLELLVLKHPRELVPLGRRVCCIVCTKSFSLMRKKYNCAACGDVMCHQCSVHQLVTAQGLSEFVGRRKARICVKCSSGLTAAELPRRTELRQSDLSSEASTARSSLSGARNSGERPRHGTEIEFRSLRAMTSFERSASLYGWPDIGGSGGGGSGDAGGDNDSAPRVHPAGAGGTGRSAMIPHMFSFRGAPAKPVPTPAPAPVAAPALPAPVVAVAADELEPAAAANSSADVDSEEDDDMEHELFDANVNITAIAPQDLDLGVGRYKEVYVQQSQSERAVDSFLSGDAEDDDTAHFLVRDSIVAAPGSIVATMEELVVEELQPGHRGSSFSLPRRSTSMELAAAAAATSASTSAADDDDDDEPPVIVRRVEKLSIGAGGRKSRESRRPRAPAPPAPMPPPPPSVAPDDAETADFTADFTVPVESVEVVAAAPTAATATAPDDSIQLSDLQVHLDRMTQISASLRELNVEKIGSSTEATVAMRRLASFERRANADVAAVIAVNFLSALDKTVGPLERPVYVPAAVQPVGPPRFVLTLAMGDGSIVDFLLDSTVADLPEPVEGALAGWKTVHSHTTGKVYYFNASCGMSSWTMPAPEMNRGAVYMVL
ncbi:hypothetical protein PybrP1_002254 [[Pythium] brassicae (nom. inval.)]|nr:hypothetical protein PybrP1_002254 [[Pythium] brassicae (nom. inval.)]